ncbi:MAG: NusG domain II-containing protein [Clostridia bacterium]|nr:NusG domain II-containing protein [Clostridia bacterium]
MTERLKLKKADVLLICFLLAAALALLLLRGGGDALTAEVTVAGETVERIDLKAVTSPYDLTLENGVRLHVEPGGISFCYSDCRGQDCVRCGVLTRAGQAAACVPNKTLVVLTGKPPKGAPDAISG